MQKGRTKADCPFIRFFQWILILTTLQEKIRLKKCCQKIQHKYLLISVVLQFLQTKKETNSASFFVVKPVPVPLQTGEPLRPEPLFHLP